MQLTGGLPFWLIKDGLIHDYPKLLNNIETNTVIIGGGISGALSAYYLTNAGIDCIVVDGRTIGLGSTCASTSLLQYELDTPLHVLSGKIGTSKAERVYRLCGNAIDKLITIMRDVNFDEFGKASSLFFSTHRSENKFMYREFNARQKAGFDVSFLSANELNTDFGLKAYYGILSQQACSTNAYLLTHALLQHSMKKGLQVFDRTCITNIQYENAMLQTAEEYIIKAKNIINATGYEVVNFIPKNIVDFYCTYAVISEKSPEKKQPWSNNTLMWNTDDPYLYMRLTNDHRIIAGGSDERFSNTFTRQSFLDKKANQLQNDLKKVLPGVSFKKEFCWSGTFGKTKDSLPYIGAYKKTSNTYYALGFGGNGITFSVVASEILCDILKGKNNIDARLFSFER